MLKGLLWLHALAAACIGCALLTVWRTGGEWAAMVLIADTAALAYAALLGAAGALLRWPRGARVPLAVVAWCLLGPLPTSLYAVLHGLKVWR